MTGVPFPEADRIAGAIVHAAMASTGSRNHAITGTALALGRLVSDHPVGQDAEIQFVEDTLSWCKAYWHEGRPS